MFDKILTTIQRLGRFSEHEQLLFTDKLKIITAAKNNIFLKKGQVCQALYFVNEGAIRQYYITENEDELTLNLFAENDWVLDFDSFAHQKPSKNALITLENSVIFELNIHDLHALIAQSQSFLLLAKAFNLGVIDSTYDILTTPEEKYKYLLATRPNILQKFSLKYIASYLKMTPETLSRVRRKITYG
jgi:CRP-like cAMP-binding protein